MLEQSCRRPDPSLLPIPRPGCPKCECRMMLLGTVIGPKGSESASSSAGAVVTASRMRSHGPRWLDCRRIEPPDLKRAPARALTIRSRPPVPADDRLQGA